MERKSWSITLCFSILIPLNQQEICNGDFSLLLLLEKNL